MVEIDIKILKVFLYVYKLKNVSVAASQLGMSQPAVSNLLNKLRKYYVDPLFIRVENEMRPTELSIQLFPLISDLLNNYEAICQHKEQFNHFDSQKIYNIAMTDVAHLVLLPQISSYLKNHAPQVQLNVHAIKVKSLELLKNGTLDLIVGYYDQLDDYFYQQKLFEQYFIVIAAKDHPRLKNSKITLDQYLSEKHIDVEVGAGHFSFENHIGELWSKRNKVMTLPSYLGVGLVVQQSDAIATVPFYLSEVLLARGNLQILELPEDFPTYSIKQFWYISNHNQKSHQWIRQVFYENLKGKDIHL
ncbi:LysR family transcriptional regulator [Acinetobacter sp. TGL-Y2]|uniref:LysR substrate-binding domain-containing protein n=1 Tax=Acinetobacter sp. TGL-Y2 TaxID=1407071 RepID=UPI0007A67459|nr:LysR substrate-binding domain-containing protein [Acinetobacter sp. TGL-Y2]AMW79162.1 LysR family transcriptional regulator [Acinetobacter sp. TGL-Y2]